MSNKDDSSDLDSSIYDEYSPQPRESVTQKAVFGSDTESENDDKQKKSPNSDSPKVDSDEGEESADNASVNNSASQNNKSLLKKNDLFSDESGSDGQGIEEDDHTNKINTNASIIDDDDGAEISENENDEVEDEAEEPDETRISVDFPLIRTDLGREIHLVKMPNFLSVETRPFDPNYYEDELDEDEVLDEEGRTRLKLKVENTIRWRIDKTPEGEMVHESNARIVRWSDGSLSLHLGDEIFDIHKVDIQSDYNYLFIREGSGLQGQSALKTKLIFRPHSTDSFTHRKITLSLVDKTSKAQKVKILPIAGADPETNRNALVRKEEEKLRATLRRESQLRRMREKQAMNRSGFGSDRRRSHGDDFEDDEDDEEDDGHTTSLNALKRRMRNNSFEGTKKDTTSAIYASSSESLSDISEPTQRKKVRARISDDENSD